MVHRPARWWLALLIGLVCGVLARAWLRGGATPTDATRDAAREVGR